MKNKLLVSSFRKIWDTRKKFLSLLCMALLGVGFFAGIKATSPDMSKTLDEYLDNNNVYDVEIVSTLGLTGVPLIFSITINKILPPSNAGKGIKLTNPTFIDINAHK